MDKLLPGIGMLAVAAVIFVMIGIGWRNRRRRQADVDPLPAVPARLDPAITTAAGQYVTTTTAGDWLDRIAVHGLGIRTNAVLQAHPEGALFERTGAGPLFIPAGNLTGIRLDSGMAGKFVEKDGLLVISWMLGDHELDTGFRTRRAEDKTALLKVFQELIPAGPPADADSGK